MLLIPATCKISFSLAFFLGLHFIMMRTLPSLMRVCHLNLWRCTGKRYIHTKQFLFKNVAPDEGPVKYSESKASEYHSFETFSPPRTKNPWYEKFSVLISLAVFLVYFAVLREENDLDKELDRTLYSRIDGLEEAQLQQVMKYNLLHGKDISAVEKRLLEIETEKQKLK